MLANEASRGRVSGEVGTKPRAAAKTPQTGVGETMREAGKPRIVVPDDIGRSFQSSPNIARLNNHAVVSFFSERPSNEEDLIERIRTANIVVTFRPAFTKFPKHVLAAAHALQMICISGTGVEDVDVAEATARKIAVANVPGPSNRAVAEHCLALVFS